MVGDSFRGLEGPGPLTVRQPTGDGTVATPGSMRRQPWTRVVLVLTVAVSCGTNPLSACFEEVDGSLDCSYQDFRSVDLSDRNLRNIDLSKADLSEAILTIES